MAAESSQHASQSASSAELVDLVVIGGGITGAGVAWDSALRGVRTVLFEARDYASGTSSRSSKLVHGGLRYLEQFEFGLIYEAVNERRRLRRLARHLVRPLGFVFGRYRGQKPPLALLRLGLWIYEGLVGFRVDRLHRKLSPAEATAKIPGLAQTDLQGAVYYFDAKAADARLTWEVILGARQAGAQTYNYAPVEHVERLDDGTWAVTAHVQGRGALTVRARTVVAAVGPWGNEALCRFFPELPVAVRPTKGIHLVLPADRLPVKDALVMQHPRDGRVTFVIPGRSFVYVGTTDTDYEGPLDEPGVTADDVDYLLEVLAVYFPDLHFTHADVTATWSGLRPLVQESGKSAYQISREHQLTEMASGFWSIEGGKLTTFRVMAEQAVDAVVGHLLLVDAGRDFEPVRTKREPLPGGRGLVGEADLALWIRQTAAQLDDDETLARHLVFTYGSRVLEVLPYIEQAPARIVPEQPYTEGEIRFLAEQEEVIELEDLMLRRTEIYYRDPGNGLVQAERIAEIIAQARGFDADWRQATVARYQHLVADALRFREGRRTQDEHV